MKPVNPNPVLGVLPVNKGPVILALGFRVFFFLGAVWAVTMVGLWIAVYSCGWEITPVFDPMQWHGREMLFGFCTAIIAGFLLTAPGFWTGAKMPSGTPLGFLALWWLVGRILPLCGDLVPRIVAATVDVSFLVVLAVFLGQLLWRYRQTRNMVFPFLILLMALANALSYLPLRTSSGAAWGTESMLFMVTGVVVIMGGRIIPGFTRGRFPKGKTCSQKHLDVFSLAVLGIAFVLDLFVGAGWWLYSLYLLAALSHAMRLALWWTPEVKSEPMLWILYLGYAWLVVGLALKAMAAAGLTSPLLARHALTVGGIGTIILGMICRVTLGHTGRLIKILPGTRIAFVCILLASLTRVFLPLIVPSAYTLSVVLAGLFWLGAFGLYLGLYGHLLFRPRADGAPG